MSSIRTFSLVLAASFFVGTAYAQVGSLPAAMQQGLNAPNANVQTVALTYAEQNPQYSAQLLQSALDILGINTQRSANEMKQFADEALLLIGPGPNHNAGEAGALALAVENIFNDPQNTALVNGPFKDIVAAAKAEADSVLQNPEVIQAAVPGAGGGIAFGGFGSFGGSGAGGSGSSSSPSRP